MRVVAGTLEARRFRLVWHVPKCVALDYVHWVDDVTCDYAQYITPILMDYTTREAKQQIFKVKKIEIKPLQGVILIDPLEDAEDETLEQELALET